MPVGISGRHFEVLGIYHNSSEIGAREDWQALRLGQVGAHMLFDKLSGETVTVFSSLGTLSPETGEELSPKRRMFAVYMAGVSALSQQGLHEVDVVVDRGLTDADAEQALRQYTNDDVE